MSGRWLFRHHITSLVPIWLGMPASNVPSVITSVMGFGAYRQLACSPAIWSETDQYHRAID